MTLIVGFLGALIVLLGALGLASPARFRGLFDVMSPQTRYIMAVVIRILMGILLWVLADDLRHPHVMRILAVIAVVAAIVILVLGRARLDRFVDWWLARPDKVIRVSALFAAVFGAYLVYVAM